MRKTVWSVLCSSWLREVSEPCVSRRPTNAVLWTSGPLRCVWVVLETLPETRFVQMFDATKPILTQRCDTWAAAAQLAEALRKRFVDRATAAIVWG